MRERPWGRQRSAVSAGLRLLALGALLVSRPAAAETVLIEAGSPITYYENTSSPVFGMTWILGSYDDSTWPTGTYGVGYETGSGAQNLIQTEITPGAISVFTRTTFNINDTSQVMNLFLGVDYDDAWAAWINGVEVFRSPELPLGALSWDSTLDAQHESSNGTEPLYSPQRAISIPGIPALQNGDNVLAVAVWNWDGSSSDLVLVPQLTMNIGLTVSRSPYLQLPGAR